MTPQGISARLMPTAYAGLLALSFMGYPLVAGASLALGGYERGASVAFRGVMLALALTVLGMASVQRLRWPRGAILIVGAFWFALLVRFLWDLSIVSLPIDLPWDEYLITILGVTFVPALALARLPDLECLQRAASQMRVLGIIASMGVAAGVYALLEEIQKMGRLGFESLNPISVGHMGVTLVIVAVFAGSRGRLGMLIRVLAALLGFVLTIASGSRGPALALAIALIVGTLASSYRRGGLAKALLVGMVTLVLMSAATVAVLQSSLAATLPFISRIADAASGRGDQSTSDRNELMTGALQEFEEAPLTGASFVERKIRFYPHNVVVETAMTTGFLGLALLTLIFATSVLACLSLLSSPHAWLGLVYLQYFVSAMVSGSLYFDGTFWAVTLALLGAWHLYRGRVTGKLPSAPSQVAGVSR